MLKRCYEIEDLCSCRAVGVGDGSGLSSVELVFGDTILVVVEAHSPSCHGISGGNADDGDRQFVWEWFEPCVAAVQFTSPFALRSREFLHHQTASWNISLSSVVLQNDV